MIVVFMHNFQIPTQALGGPKTVDQLVPVSSLDEWKGFCLEGYSMKKLLNRLVEH